MLARAMTFTDPSYLASGNARQRRLHAALQQLRLMERLAPFAPVIAGTLPLAIDTPESDVDVLCHCPEHSTFQQHLQREFGKQSGFGWHESCIREQRSTIARFEAAGFEFEVFGQSIPVEQQYGYRHLCVEHRILKEQGPDFRARIRALKQQGIKTEPAFAQLLGLAGDPYEALLTYSSTNPGKAQEKT